MQKGVGMGGGWFNMHMELPSKLKDANVNEIMTTMMMGTYLRWICRLGPMQLKWAEDTMSCQALSLSINCCPSTVAQPAGRIMSSVGGCVCLHICIHMCIDVLYFAYFGCKTFGQPKTGPKLCGLPLHSKIDMFINCCGYCFSIPIHQKAKPKEKKYCPYHYATSADHSDTFLFGHTTHSAVFSVT